MTQVAFWTPPAAAIALAQVTRVADGLGLLDFDALLRLSTEHPDRYWHHLMSALPIVWSKPYHTYLDTSDGMPFPRWFLGGELNWIDTIFAPHAPERTAIIAETETGLIERISYQTLQHRVAQFAGGLKALGLGRGDRIGLLLEMGVEAVISLLAVSHIGAIAAPLFTGFGSEALVARLADSAACALIITTGFHRRGRWVDIAALVEPVRARLPGLRQVILKGGRGAKLPIANVADWYDVATAPAAGPAERMTANDPMMVIYTSGTTGKPKGIVHTHGGFPLKIAHDSAVHFDVAPGDIFFWPADLGWIAGSLIIAAALMRGATLVCYDGAPDFPDWSRLSHIVAANGVTHFGASPTLIRGLAANAAQATSGTLDSIRVLITAGEVIDPEHMIWFHRRFGRSICPVINYTGGTEVSGALLANVVARPIVAAAFNTVSPGVAADVLDESGKPVDGIIGELSILAPFVGMTQSFWQDRTRYLETYWSQSPGVWTHGDLAIRKDGVLFVLGRSDDTLKVAGKRVGPAEIEDILLELPGVSEAAVIGVEDPVKGQRLIVFVVATADDGALERRIVTMIGERLGKPFQPSRVHVVAQLPRTRSMKVMRRVIRRVYENADPGDLSSLENPAAIALIAAAAQA